MKSYHLTQEQVLEIASNLELDGHYIFVWKDGYIEFENKTALQLFVNAVLDKVLGEPVGEVEVRKQRILVDTFQQVTTPIADGRHKLYAPKEQS